MEKMSTDSYEEDAGPSTYVRGYHKLAQENPEPPPAYATPSSIEIPHDPYPGVVQPPYAPAPQSFNAQQLVPQSFNTQQQSSNTNVVVVNQPSEFQYELFVEETVREKPEDHLLLTTCTLIFCCAMGNWFALICVIPALVLSLAANSASQNRNYVSAKSFANYSLGCNTIAYIQFVVVFILGAILLAVVDILSLWYRGSSEYYY